MEERLINFVTNPPALFESIGNFFLPIFIFVGDKINSSPILSATAGLAIIFGSGIYAKIIWEKKWGQGQ